MIVPEEFKRLASGFYQGSDREVSTEQEWIKSALQRLDTRQKRVVKRFLADLLAGNHDEGELQRIWNSTPADYYVSGKGGLREFFTMIKEAIE